MMKNITQLDRCLQKSFTWFNVMVLLIDVRESGTYFAVISRVISLIKIGILIVMANPVTPEKKGKRPTTFKDTYKKDFPCIGESRKGPTHAFCTG